MLTVLISWILILFVFLSLGSIFVSLYRLTSRRDARVSLPDRFIFGMIAATVVVSFTSFWLPANHYILFALVAAGMCGILVVRRQIALRWRQWTVRLRRLSALEKTIIALSVLAFVLLVLCCGIPQYDSFDSLYYHMSFTRWAEEYPVITGLANIEERFGFNSNYLLLSAPFTLRFLFNDPIFGIQSLTAAIVMLWIIGEVIRSGYELKRMLLLFIYASFVYLCKHEMALTSTDILPNLLTFYVGAKAILYPDRIRQDSMFFILVPVYIITLKMSYAFLTIASLLLLVSLLRGKDYRTLTFAVVALLLVVAPWLLRNVLISGYLIYPMTAIDWFAVDWKVPKEIVDTERMHISYHARTVYIEEIIRTFKHFHASVRYSWHLIIYVVAAISFIASAWKLYRDKTTNNRSVYIYIFAIIAAGTAYLAFTAPTIRFMYGYITSVIFMALVLWLPHNVRLNRLQMSLATPAKPIRLVSTKMGVILAILILIPLWSNGYKNINNLKHLRREYCDLKKSKALHQVFFKPMSATDSYMYVKGDNERWHNVKKQTTGFLPHALSEDITIYVSVEDRGFLFDMVPAVADKQKRSDSEWIFQDYRDLEARGKSVQDGFRSKRKDK